MNTDAIAIPLVQRAMHVSHRLDMSLETVAAVMLESTTAREYPSASTPGRNRTVVASTTEDGTTLTRCDCPAGVHHPHGECRHTREMRRELDMLQRLAANDPAWQALAERRITDLFDRASR